MNGMLFPLPFAVIAWINLLLVFLRVSMLSTDPNLLAFSSVLFKKIRQLSLWSVAAKTIVAVALGSSYEMCPPSSGRGCWGQGGQRNRSSCRTPQWGRGLWTSPPWLFLRTRACRSLVRAWSVGKLVFCLIFGRSKQKNQENRSFFMNSWPPRSALKPCPARSVGFFSLTPVRPGCHLWCSLKQSESGPCLLNTIFGICKQKICMWDPRKVPKMLLRKLSFQDITFCISR